MNKHLLIIVFILFSSPAINAQSLMTVQEIYDYNIGDIFIRKEGGYYYPPTFRRTEITNKYFSSTLDTVFYNYDFYAYTPPCGPTCPAVYDTAYGNLMFYTNLGDTVGKGLGVEPYLLDPSCIDTAGFTGTWLDSVYYDTTFCNNRIVKLEMLDNLQIIDSCYLVFEPYFGFSEYGEGLGHTRFYYNTCSTGVPQCETGMQLLYYKKGLDSCGLAPIIPLPTSINEPEFISSFTVYPNPFSTQTNLVFFETQNNSLITITNILGEVVFEMSFIGNELTLDKGELKDGIYFLHVNDRKKIETTKLIIH